ncbi:MAG: TfuA-like protein, partial [Candidatus Methanomethylicia archaeon]|nr:TfuA-like protein [Candidatus Methanomethylicia archaeon]
VIGGSSMGALRAAELDGMGMIGVGEIYKWYKEGILNSDDAVAVAFNPNTLKPISEPFVNFLATAKVLTSRGLISMREGEEILESARQLPFQLRNVSRVIQKGIQNGADVERGKELLQLLRQYWVDQKRLDALEVVKWAASLKHKEINGVH